MTFMHCFVLQIVYDSAICSEYLDECYPQKPLFPKDPFDKARVKVLMTHAGNVSLSLTVMQSQMSMFSYSKLFTAL